MSYSFNVRAATKVAVLALVAAKLDEIVAQQAVHTVDRGQAQAAAEAFINLLPDDDSRDVTVSVSGYVSGQWQNAELVSLSAASFNVMAGLVNRQPAA